MRLAIVAGLAIGPLLWSARPAGAQDAADAQVGYDAGVQGQAAQDQAAQDQASQSDPPMRVARIGVLLGNVSMEPASVNQFSAAEMNYPMTTGDRIYTDTGANAELQTGQLAVRLGQQTDLTVTAMTDTLAQFGLAQGSVHLRSFGLDPNSTLELDTPNVAVTVLQPGDVRVDVDPAGDATIVSLLSGQVEVDGNGLQQVLQAGQRVRFSGGGPVSAQWLDAAAPDGLDNFSNDRDGVYESAVAGQGDFVSPDTIGAEDLEGNGDWETDESYGAVWYPSGMAAGWAPYSCGRWAWVAPWGWTWVGCESWGFAPFHYGRWVHRGPRWGWVPGPPGLRPTYAPALVVFAGGSGFAVDGVRATAWFPLGPGEPYVPWYHASPLYVNRVNVADISTRNTEEARRIYNQRTDAYAVDPDGQADRQYVNRTLATVAMPQTSFAEGRRVSGVALRLSPEQIAEAQVLPHPLVTPQRAIVVPVAARAIPPHVARPTLATREAAAERPSLVGQGVEPSAGQALGTERPVPIERRPEAPAGTQRPPGHAAPAQGPPAQGTPAPSPADERPAAQTITPADDRTTEERGQVPQPGSGLPATRPLFNRAVPPPPRPSFEEQQKAIESSDPGRPLSPQQMQNLRQNQPVGPPQQREMPHPMALPPPRPAPAPRSSSPSQVKH